MKRRNHQPPRATRPGAYMSTSELAARWGVTEGHLRNRRVAGRPPRYFADGVVRYSVADIEQHEAAHTVTSTSANPDQETE